MKNPQKKNYIQRAHSNPFTDVLYFPKNPNLINWADYYKNGQQPTFLDLGCGYGKFLLYLSDNFPLVNSIGFEIRKKVCQYVADRIKYENKQNVNVINTNGMLFLQNFLQAHSLEKIFILFPDPHFKKRKQKARIVSKQMVHIYSYLLKIDGRIYLSSDVEEYFLEMLKCFQENEDFIQVGDDSLLVKIKMETDEAKRAGANKTVHGACFVKLK